MFHLNPQQGHFSRAPPLPLNDAPRLLRRGGGNLGIAKNPGGRRLAESGIPSRSSGWSPQMLCLSIQHP